MIFQDLGNTVFRALLVGGVFRLQVTTANFGYDRYCGRADTSFFHLPRDHVIKRSRDLIDGVFQP